LSKKSSYSYFFLISNNNLELILTKQGKIMFKLCNNLIEIKYINYFSINR
jgi:hypothetical protein